MNTTNVSAVRAWNAAAVIRGWLFTLTSAALVIGVVQAQGAAVVDPPSVVHTAQPGSTVEGAVRLTNLAGNVLPLRLYLSDWSFDEVGNFTFSEVGSTERSVSDWLSFAPTALEVAPNGSAVVRYQVTVPQEAAPGTHWSVLFAESEPSDPAPGQPGASISIRVGHIVYVNVAPLTSEGTVLGIFGEPPSERDDAYRLFVQYANTGNAAQGVQGELNVLNALGEVVIEAAIERQVVLPESSRILQINLIGPLEAGNYTALVVLEYGDAEVEVAGTHDFTLVEDLTAPSGE